LSSKREKVDNVEKLRRLAVYYKHVAESLRRAADGLEAFADTLNHAAAVEEGTGIVALEVGRWLGRESE